MYLSRQQNYTACVKKRLPTCPKTAMGQQRNVKETETDHKHFPMFMRKTIYKCIDIYIHIYNIYMCIHSKESNNSINAFSICKHITHAGLHSADKEREQEKAKETSKQFLNGGGGRPPIAGN